MRNKATKKNMDLDLRRYGKMLYTKAEESGGSGGSGGGEDSAKDFFNSELRSRIKQKVIGQGATEEQAEEYLSRIIFPDEYVFNLFKDNSCEVAESVQEVCAKMVLDGGYVVAAYIEQPQASNLYIVSHNGGMDVEMYKNSLDNFNRTIDGTTYYWLEDSSIQ